VDQRAASEAREERERLASRLCRDCALCCDGALFARVPLVEGEPPPPGVRVAETAGGGRYLPQPCAALVDRACAAYAERPRACRTYRCLLVGALEAGEVGLREALRAVERARDWRASEDETACEDFFAFTFGRR
jgi:uncharacterized protein